MARALLSFQRATWSYWYLRASRRKKWNRPIYGEAQRSHSSHFSSRNKAARLPSPSFLAPRASDYFTLLELSILLEGFFARFTAQEIQMIPSPRQDSFFSFLLKVNYEANSDCKQKCKSIRFLHRNFPLRSDLCGSQRFTRKTRDKKKFSVFSFKIFMKSIWLLECF